MSQANGVSESDFQRALMDAIGSNPRFRLWRQLVGKFYWMDHDGNFHPLRVGPPKGAADLTGFVWGTGTRIEWEVKSASGRLSPEQERWGRAMNAGGVIHRVSHYDNGLSLKENVQREMAWLEAAT